MVKTKKAIALMRSSNKNQRNQRDEILGQFNAIHTYAKKVNIDVAEAIEYRQVFENNTFAVNDLMSKAYSVCGFNPDVNCLLVTDISRISRDYEQYKYWEKAFKDIGVELRMVNGTSSEPSSPTTELMENIYHVISKYDSAMRSERVKRGLRHKKELKAKN